MLTLSVWMCMYECTIHKYVYIYMLSTYLIKYIYIFFGKFYSTINMQWDGNHLEHASSRNAT